MSKPFVSRRAAAFLSGALALAPLPALAAVYVTVVQGLAGVSEYEEKFNEQRQRLLDAARSMTEADLISVFEGEQATRESLLAHFESLAGKMTGQDRAIIYLVGHGSFDETEYKFNIPGPDLTTGDLQEILDALPGSNHFLVNTSSTSGALLEPLEDESRVVVTATRSGGERNATEFGEFFTQALSSEEADIDKNNSISAQEAFDYAERRVSDFFESSGRIATEHPQLRGDSAAQLVLARVGSSEPTSDDPEIVSLMERRQEIDREIEELQLRRDELSAAEYTQSLRELILESAAITEQITTLGEEGNGAAE